MSEVIIDNGPWHTGVTSDGRHYLESDDFTHDVRLYIDGDFAGDDDKARYAKGIEIQINGSLMHGAVSAEPVAWLVMGMQSHDKFHDSIKAAEADVRGRFESYGAEDQTRLQPLYTAPVAAQAQPDAVRNKYDWVQGPYVTDTMGSGWCVRIDGTDIFADLNQHGCKGRVTFQIAHGLSSKEEAEATLAKWLRSKSISVAAQAQPDDQIKLADILNAARNAGWTFERHTDGVVCMVPQIVGEAQSAQSNLLSLRHIERLRSLYAAQAPQKKIKAQAQPDLIRFDYVNADGQPDSKMITHDEMRERYAVCVRHAYGPRAQQPVSGADGLRVVLEEIHDWMDSQADSQRKGCHATFDIMILRELRDKARAALDHLPDATKMVELYGNSGELPPLPKPDSYLFQHEETGLTECVDGQQVGWGFEKNNPRHQKIGGMFTEGQMQDYARAAIDAARKEQA
ncbi:hypothetical protein CASP1_00017 [Alcaligenes phage CASP1]|nr:hypothetical protein CASP1_00017 [Alcaligenes phage CASP1]